MRSEKKYGRDVKSVALRTGKEMLHFYTSEM